MPGKSVAADATFILVALNEKGAIESATSFCARPVDGKRAGEARALIAGVNKYELYRLKAGKGDGLEFERLR